jgi:hypothetical protein
VEGYAELSARDRSACIEGVVAPFNRATHEDRKDGREQPMNVLDVSHRSAVVGNGLDRKFAKPFEEPWG